MFLLLVRCGFVVFIVVLIMCCNFGVLFVLLCKDEKMSVVIVSKDDKGVEKGEEKVIVLKDM